MAVETEGLVIDPHLLESLSRIELRSRLLVRGLYHNRHRTTDFGASNEFVEHRDYNRGDELRTVDWRLYARTSRLYVKRYEMEANMRVHFLLDTSDSMRVPPPAGLPTKLDLAATIVAAVATMVVTQQDAAGLWCLGERIEQRVPARQGMRHLAMLMQLLGRPKGSGGGGLGSLLAEATPQLGSRGVIFLVSDLLDDLEPTFAALRNLCARRQDVTIFQVLDRSEMEFPYDRLTEFRHPESGAKVVGDPNALREKYLQRLGEHLARIEAFCRRHRVDYLRIHNGEDLIKLLRSHFLRRLLHTRA
jgi:uncharacterized protein (DUF58 family)